MARRKSITRKTGKKKDDDDGRSANNKTSHHYNIRFVITSMPEFINCKLPKHHKHID